jgi:hypothetical protein
LFEQEPGGLGEGAYVEYCLDFVRRRAPGYFWPGRKLVPILRDRQRFEALGVRLLAAGGAETLAFLQNKARVYRAAQGLEVAIPDHEVVNDLAGFDAAWQRLRPRHSRLCYKPAVSVYGIGFHVVADRGGAPTPGTAGNPVFIGLDAARSSLAKKGSFGDLLVMQYLPGPERSIDCLAADGELIRCVVRRKEEGGQVLEDNPALVQAVRRLTAHFRLTHLFNVQFRDAGGKSYLLEINPRMSGGLPFACQSGLALPYWALRLALGTVVKDDVPQPCTGVWVPQPVPVSSL